MPDPTDPMSLIAAPTAPEVVTLDSLAAELKAKCPHPTLAAYAPEIAAATMKLIVEPDGPQVVTPRQFMWLKAAIIWRETMAGFAPGMVPVGPAGSGDWTARGGPKWCATPHCKLINSPEELPKAWAPARTALIVDGKVTYPLHAFPWVIPDDDRGWGRGLGQGDWASQWEFIQQVNSYGVPLWQIPESSILWTAGILLGHLTHFPEDFGAGCAAYNDGDGSEAYVLAHGEDVDAGTTGKNYSRAVLTWAAEWGGLALLAPKEKS